MVFFPKGKYIIVQTILSKTESVMISIVTDAQSKSQESILGLVWYWKTWEPWPQLHQTPLGWDRTQIVSQALMSRISYVWPHKCSSGSVDRNSHRHTQVFYKRRPTSQYSLPFSVITNRANLWDVTNVSKSRWTFMLISKMRMSRKRQILIYDPLNLRQPAEFKRWTEQWFNAEKKTTAKQ